MADSRPRVRGRFAKNDEFGELTKQGSSGHYDDEDGVRNPVCFNSMYMLKGNVYIPVWFTGGLKG